ncbi:MAG: hypothetical protein WCT40_01520 [Candidatus Magasanikbacteria bacterium]|jgi:hypothetical protein
MFYSPKLFVRDLWIGIPLVVTVSCVAIVSWYVVAHIHPTDAQIFLHYNAIFGIDLIGPWWQMYFLPIFATAIFLINFSVALWFYRADKFLARLLAVLAAVWEIFLVVATILIVGLNI